MIRVLAAGASDVGRQRAANEDAYHVGDSVFAVADGMGGHVAGEIASTTALEPISDLDGRIFPDAAAATTALRDAVVAANDAVVTKAAGDPSYRGMGTTLTAVMVEGRRAHVAHVGDSRAYLLRDGGFSQLTTDHTLVQRLIDEGRLTREQAARHPQRSVITRAIGVEPEVEVDAMVLELEPGDALLLCSDGLTGPVADDTIAAILSDEDIDQVVRDLISKANEAGGPDNITAVVLRFEELATAPTTNSSPNSVVIDHHPMVQVRTRPDADDSGDWASRLSRLGDLNRDRGTGADADSRPDVSTGQRATAIVVAVGLLLGVVLAGGRWMLSRSYFVGVDGDQVVIYQGVPGNLGPIPLSWEETRTDLTIDDVPPLLRDDVEAGMTATDRRDAENIVVNFERQAAEDGAPEEPSPTEAPTP